MIDFHTHTFASDGVLVPSELIRRAVATGYRAIGITDHADESNLQDLIGRAVRAAEAWAGQDQILVVPGVEITHVPPERIPAVARYARDQGARLVIVHGETVTEPVAPGTNAAAIRCLDVDVLAHPGLISKEDAEAAAESGVLLEITARNGHSAGNGRVARMAQENGADLVINTDAHEPKDLISRDRAHVILAAAGLEEDGIQRAFANAEKLLKRVTGNR